MRSRSFLSTLVLVSLCAGVGWTTRAWCANPASSPQDAGATQSATTLGYIPSPSEAVIPGPLRSFERMAAISQKAAPEDVLPLFALNVVEHGYHRPTGGGRTEYLDLVERYLGQATDLEALAGKEGVIRVSGCDQAKPLLKVLGYRLKQPCGRDTSLETADSDRAFLTIDSGFPLAQLEESLRTGKPFTYPYASSRVPLMLTAADWSSVAKHHPSQENVIGAIEGDPVLARLYWAMSQLDSQTRKDLKQSVGIGDLLQYAAVLAYYGAEIRIRSGRVQVPGGVAAESAWRSLVGASPANPGGFVRRLLKKDDGWLAAYYDALSRISPDRQAYFTQAGRLKTFYEALRGDDLKPRPARPAFRPDPGLLLLMARVQFDSDGQPHVPGNLQVWKTMVQESKSKSIRKWASRARRWKRPEQLLAAMFAFSRLPIEDGPLHMYLLLSEIDSGRSATERLTPQTATLLINNFSQLGDQYLLLTEFHRLDNSAIALFIHVAKELDGIRSFDLRTNAVGTFQAEVGLWQILARQGEIPDVNLSKSFKSMIRPFSKISDPSQLFVASQTSFQEMCRAATGKTTISQDAFITVLAGPKPTNPEAEQVRQQITDNIRSVMSDQRLVSLDTLFTLGTGLKEMAQGTGKVDVRVLLPLAAELNQFQLPQPIFTPSERSRWSFGTYNNQHTSAQMRTDLVKIIQAPRSPQELLDARGLLTPFLRDSLVGLNYAFYEPPGAEMVRNDPLFVRSQDFSGTITPNGKDSWQTPFLIGRGRATGGGAHLVGSLANLPYVLADVEQDFIVPQNVQALIWRDMVPTLLVDAVVPRWWGISRNEIHAVALYQRAGEELLTASASNGKLLGAVMDILSERMLPARLERIENDLRAGSVDEALPEVTPADTFYLTATFRSRFPEDKTDWGPAGRELNALAQRDPNDASFSRLSKDFGVPHPALALTYSRQLLNMKPIPTFMGYSSRLLAESWDSDNLYWARLADQMGYAPVMMNILVPELTRLMVSKIFATNHEDWPAVLRAMRETGTEFRRGKVVSLPKPEVESTSTAVMPQ